MADDNDSSKWKPKFSYETVLYGGDAPAPGSRYLEMLIAMETGFPINEVDMIPL